MILVAVVLLTVQLVIFSRMRANYPAGMEIAGVPVGGLDRQATAERLLEAYSVPVELQYNEAIIHLNPSLVGFNLNLESMLAAADLERTSRPFWTEFWDYLWGRQHAPRSIPLDATISDSLLQSYLDNEISPRYDKPATPAQPVPGTVNFQVGVEGTTIDVDSAIFQIQSALRSPSRPSVDLTLRRTRPPRPSLKNLQTLLQQTVDLADFEGLVGVYLLDLQTAQELHFLYEGGEFISTQPDVAFSAASTIKIPIMVSAYRRLGANPPEEALNLLTGMIEQSGNDPADWLIQQYIDLNRGPLDVTADMRALGLENTFLAGYFRIGSPLLAFYETPANSREDIDTDPDLYNQTTLSDIGMLLADIYQCAESGGGALVALFPGEITQPECQDMVELLTRNKMPSLLEAGIPEGTRIAHKHGWVQDIYGAITVISDAGIIYTPSGNYVLVIFFSHPVQLIWESASTLFGQLSEAVYNYYNLPAQ